MVTGVSCRVKANSELSGRTPEDFKIKVPACWPSPDVNSTPKSVMLYLSTIRREVMNMTEPTDSKTVKAGSKTYFFDLRETKEGQPFLTITESRFKGEGQDRERSSIVVFPDNAQDFLEATQGMIEKLS